MTLTSTGPQTIGTDSHQSASAPADVSAEGAEPYAGPSGSATTVHSGGQLVEGLGDGPLAEAGEIPAASQPAPEIVVIEGQGSLYDPLIEGKHDGEEGFSPARKAHAALLVVELESLRRRLEGAGVAVVDGEPLPGFDRFYATTRSAIVWSCSPSARLR